MEVLKLEMENIKNEIIEKDKEIRIKESEIRDLVNKLGSQFDMEKQFKEKVDIPEKKISELEKENKDLKININELKSENESLTDQIAVSDILHDSFKETNACITLKMRKVTTSLMMKKERTSWG